GGRGIDRVSRAALASGPPAREKTAAARLRGGVQFQPQRRSRGRPPLHRSAENFFPSRQCRGCEIAGDSSGEHHALSHERRGARAGGHRPGHYSSFDRARRSRRSEGRYCARPARGAKRLTMELKVANQTVYAYTGGKNFDAKPPTVVFIHGGEQDHSIWVLQSRYLAHHGFGVLALDLPAHGRSRGAPLERIEDMADWVVGVLAAAGVTAAALI